MVEFGLADPKVEFYELHKKNNQIRNKLIRHEEEFEKTRVNFLFSNRILEVGSRTNVYNIFNYDRG